MVVAGMIAITGLAILLVGVAGLLIPAVVLEHRWSAAAWRDAALVLGLDRSSPNRLIGTFDGWEIEVSMSGPGKNTVLRVSASGAPPGLSLRARNPLRGLFGRPPPVTGDVGFDRTVWAEVPPTELGLLGQEARASPTTAWTSFTRPGAL